MAALAKTGSPGRDDPLLRAIEALIDSKVSLVPDRSKGALREARKIRV